MRLLRLPAVMHHDFVVHALLFPPHAAEMSNRRRYYRNLFVGLLLAIAVAAMLSALFLPSTILTQP